MEQHECPLCAQGKAQGDAFCENCGAELRPKTHCKNCGTPLPPAGRFCKGCGRPLPESVLRSRPTAVQPERSNPSSLPSLQPASVPRRTATPPPTWTGGGDLEDTPHKETETARFRTMRLPVKLLVGALCAAVVVSAARIGLPDALRNGNAHKNTEAVDDAGDAVVAGGGVSAESSSAALGSAQGNMGQRTETATELVWKISMGDQQGIMDMFPERWRHSIDHLPVSRLHESWLHKSFRATATLDQTDNILYKVELTGNVRTGQGLYPEYLDNINPAFTEEAQAELMETITQMCYVVEVEVIEHSWKSTMGQNGYDNEENEPTYIQVLFTENNELVYVCSTPGASYAAQDVAYD